MSKVVEGNTYEGKVVQVIDTIHYLVASLKEDMPKGPHKKQVDFAMARQNVWQSKAVKEALADLKDDECDGFIYKMVWTPEDEDNRKYISAAVASIKKGKLVKIGK